MSSTLHQLLYLLYKNFLLKWRNKKQTLIELVAIIYFIAILAVIKQTAPKQSYEEITDSERPKLSVKSFPVAVKKVGYVIIKSKGVAVDTNNFIEMLEKTSALNFSKFADEVSLDKYYKENGTDMSHGVIFEFKENLTISYTIKSPYDDLPKPTTSKISDDKVRCRDIGFFHLHSCPAGFYLTKGFALLQSYIDYTFMQLALNKSTVFNVDSKVQMFPKASFEQTASYLQNVVGIYMVIAFSPYILFLLTFVVSEKEKKIKEAMKIMGLNMTAFWLSWFITYAIIILFGCVLVTLVSVGVNLYNNSNYFIIFLLLYLYGLSIITLSFTLTPLFKKARNAGTFGSMATMLLSLLSLLHTNVETSNGVKWVTCLLSPVALSLGLQAGLDSKKPLTWSNISSGDFPAGNALIMLIVDTVLYLLMAAYLDAVFPGEYGKAKHPLFIFKISFWKRQFLKDDPNKLHRHSSLVNSPIKTHNLHDDDIEELPEQYLDKKVISVGSLFKIFKQGKKKPEIRAVDGVSFDIYEGQITALLGHNGAGKSTLISILTGMLTPSQGTAELYGLNLRDSEEMDEIRKIIGLCPQQNIIFDQLTPREHLKLFAGIKGLPSDGINEVINSLLVEIDLKDQADVISKGLSGGQKRKLCVGIALIGNPKVVFLDEPTSGMDPSSRRKIWALLQAKRHNRVLFLTTHFMDEADILADYKIIMSKGKIRCAGSSLFLKSRFGIGYHLGMVVNQMAEKESIVDIVMDTVPGASLSRQHGKELAFRLPLPQAAKFPDLFKHFEDLNDSNDVLAVPKLGVVSYGVSMTTLEEVFLKLEESEEQELEPTNENKERSNETEKSEPHSANHLIVESAFDKNSFGGSSTDLHNSAMRLDEDIESHKTMNRRDVSFWVHLKALLEVRFWLSIRSPSKIFFLGVLPPILMVVGIVLAQNQATSSSKDTGSSLKLDASLYLKNINSTSTDLTEILYNLFKQSESSYMNDLFKSLSLQSHSGDFDLLKSAPHHIAYNILKVHSSGTIEYNLRYNDSAVHSLPVGINTLHNGMFNIMMQKAFGVKNEDKTNRIEVYTKPFASRKPRWEYDASSLFSSMLIGLSFTGMIGAFAIEAVMYRQLRVSGLNRIMYWAHFLLGDMMMFILPVIVMYICIAALNVLSLNMPAAMFCLFLCVILYLPGSIMFTYTLAFIFQNWETAQNVMPTLINMVSLAPYFVVSIVDMTSMEIGGTLHAQLAIGLSFAVPPCSVLICVYYIGRIHRVVSILTQNNDIDIALSKYFDMKPDNPLPAIFIVMFVHVILFCWTTYAIDCYKAGGVFAFPFSMFNKLSIKKKSKAVRSQASIYSNDHRVGLENQDVTKERERVKQTLLENSVKSTSVVAHNLRKRFKKKVAVKDINLQVDRGEIFGILGPNGAGKTTTLNMITADIHPDRGQVFIDGYNISYELSDAFQSLGYCPQFDALYADLTLREHLKLYGLIKGVPKQNISTIIERYATSLKITEHLDKRSKHLSGGTKRKLSFLISMIGSSSIIIMDEPSTGMDPSARRFLWSAISSNIIGSKGAMLTTHSMEEADALCARVGIVVKGELKCVGTTQELKTTYGGGYQLEIKFNLRDDINITEQKMRVDEYVRRIFNAAEEMEYFGSRVTYKISKDQVTKLSVIFAALEKGKRDADIEEYSFSQSTLEQVFLEFAKEQELEDGIVLHDKNA